MFDSITVANLPGGGDAYAGYVDGRYANLTALHARFPGKHILEIAVFSGTDAECADCETGDMTPAQMPAWVHRQMARGVHRPVVYSSISVMPTVQSALSGAGIKRSDVRLWSAHYGAGKHICGGMDGTQWTDHSPGTGGSFVDESVLADNFFGGAVDMPLTDADAAKVAAAVWQIAGQVVDPNPPAGGFRTPAHTLTETLRQVYAIQSTLGAEPGKVATAVLAQLDPHAIATAIATQMGPDLGHQVLLELQKQLAKP